MPVLPFDSYDSLIGKFVVTPHGQMLVEEVDLQSMTALGLLTSTPEETRYIVSLETVLDSEVTEVDWRDPEVIEKWLQGEPVVDDVRLDTPPPAEPAFCACKCGVKGGCYRLAVRGRTLAGHQKVPAHGCSCEARRCGCMPGLPAGLATVGPVSGA